MEKDTFMGRLGEFAQGVAAGFDPTKPQSMAGSLAAGTAAIQERQPEITKAEAEAEALEGNLKTKQAMAELSQNYIKAIKDLSNDIDASDMGRIVDIVYKSFGYTIGPDGNLRGIGGKAISSEEQMKVNKKLLDATKEYKSGGFTAVAELLAEDNKVKPKDPKKDGTIINNDKIKKFVQPNKV